MLLQDIMEMSGQEASIVRSIIFNTFKKYNVSDVLLGVHFRERLQDREEQVSAQEIINAFIKARDKYGASIFDIPPGHSEKTWVVQDFETNLNIPIVVRLDARTNKYHIHGTTIMRKKPSSFKFDNFDATSLPV